MMEQKKVNFTGMSPERQALIAEAQRNFESKLQAGMEVPQGIDSEESMMPTEAEIEEAKQSIRRRRPSWRKRSVKSKGGVSGKTRARPSGPPVYYSLETGQPIETGVPGEIGTVIDEEVRRLTAEIAAFEIEIGNRRNVINLLHQSNKRMAVKTKPAGPSLQEITEDPSGPKPGSLAEQTIAVLRKEGRPLYIAELARLMGYHGPKRKNALLGSVSSYASKGKYGIIRTAPSVYALAEWGKVTQQ